MFLQDALPAASDAFTCQVKNPFDLHQKRRCQEERRVYDAQRACLTAARQRIVTMVQGLTPVRATPPDIGGAVVEAAATFAAYPTAAPWLASFEGKAQLLLFAMQKRPC